MEIELLDMKRGNQGLREERKKMENDLFEIRRDLEEERSKSKQLQLAIDRMRSMTEHLEKTKDDVVQRLQATNQEKLTENQEKSLLLHDIQEKNKQLILKD